jgi:hypothetical protein
MKARAFESAAITVVLAAIMFLAVEPVFAAWPGPDYDCECKHAGWGGKDQWVGADVRGYYSSNPNLQYVSEVWHSSRGTDYYPPYGNMIMHIWFDGDYMYGEVAGQWEHYESANVQYGHFLGCKTKSTFTDNQGNYWNAETLIAQVYSSP